MKIYEKDQLSWDSEPGAGRGRELPVLSPSAVLSSNTDLNTDTNTNTNTGRNTYKYIYEYREAEIATCLVYLGPVLSSNTDLNTDTNRNKYTYKFRYEY